MARIWNLLLNLLPGRRRRMERDLERELRHHMDRRVEDLRHDGLSDAEARRQAAIEFGGIAQVQEEVRDTWMWRWLDHLRQDLRYAGRTLRRSPGFAATALLSLALGIGGNAAIFSLVDEVLLQLLPVKEPERLAHLNWLGRSFSTGWGAGNLMSYPLCRDLQEETQVFDGAFCRHPATVNFSMGHKNEPARAEIVSGSYFEVLGVRPELGRLIDPSDDRHPGAHPVVVLAHHFWQSRFGGAPDAIGRKVLLNNYPMTVIGIAPASFPGIDPLAVPALWLPAMMTQQAANLDPGWDRLLDRRAVWMHVFGRLKPGLTADDAKAGLQPWFKARLEADTRLEGFPGVSAEERRIFLSSSLDVLPAHRGLSILRDRLERPLWVLMGGTVLLLVLACLNVAGLLLARGAARTRELTTRMAIGATRGRITSQLLVESMLLTLGGGVLGLAVAPAVARVLLSFLSQDGDLTARLNTRVLLFAFLASVATGTVCGLAPAFQIRRIPLIASLNERSRIVAAGGVRLRKLLVIGQMAFTLLLLIGAGLFVQTLARLHERVGFASTHLLMVSLEPLSIGYSEPDAEQAMREVLRRLRDLPVVERAAVANTSLLTGGWTAGNLTIQADGRILTDRSVSRMRVGPGFFATLGTQVIAGRDFEERDVRAPGTQPTPYRSAIVNEGFARRYFKDRSPIGYRVGLGTRPGTVTDIEIIGVVRDFSRRSLRDGELEQLFVPFWDRDSDGGTFYVKTRGRADAAFAPIRAAIADVVPTLPITLRTFDDQVARSLNTERMLATLSSGFGALALLLSVIGLYGVMSFVVTQRTQEIGVRLALGATRGDAVWLVMRDAAIMIGAGTLVALPAAWALRRLVDSQLFGIRAFDGPTIALASGVLALVALAAAMLPAWRAASVSPTEALRAE